jgi:hypothetical protein
MNCETVSRFSDLIFWGLWWSQKEKNDRGNCAHISPDRFFDEYGILSAKFLIFDLTVQQLCHLRFAY